MRITYLSHNPAGCRVQSALRAGAAISSQTAYNTVLFENLKGKGLFEPAAAGTDYASCLESTKTARACLFNIRFNSTNPHIESLLEDTRMETFVQCLKDKMPMSRCEAWASAFV